MYLRRLSLREKVVIPEVSERHWGTCREDYAPHGNSWIYLPFEAVSDLS